MIFKQKYDAQETNRNTSGISINDRIRFNGVVKCIIEEWDEYGIKTVTVHHKSNLVVNVGKENLVYLLAAPQTTRHITQFQIGIDGNGTNNILTPVPPLDTDTALYDPNPFVKDFAGYTLFPADSTKNEIQFSVVMETTEGNGTGTVAYTEAGMFTLGGVMLARETFPAVIKTANRRITFLWSVLF